MTAFELFVKVTGKQLCQSPLFDTVAGLRCTTMLKISKNTFFHRTPPVTSSVCTVGFLMRNTAGELGGKNQ